MQNRTLAEVVSQGFLDHWSAVARVKKPLIAAVNGFAVNLLNERHSLLCSVFHS